MLTVLACQAPIKEAEENEKDLFYEQYSKCTSAEPAHDMTLVTEDMNAEVGHDNRNKDKTMGRQGLGVMNVLGCYDPNLSEFKCFLLLGKC